MMGKPILKWPGGKRQLLPELIKRLPKEGIYQYHEPFFGGGALFFAIQDKFDFAVINDINSELMNVYITVRDDIEELIKELKKHQNNEEYFLSIRGIDRLYEYHHGQEFSYIQKAARFIYLNKTCFNGLYRVNSKGHFNVPFGHYKNPKILDEENLRSCHKILREKHVEITCDSFNGKDVESICESNIEYYTNWNKCTFVYLDPPYIPLTKTSNFTSYTSDGFSYQDHLNLRDWCNELTENNVKWMQSNSSAKEVFELYKNYNIDIVSAKRSISAKNNGRLPVDEVIITNYKY